MTIIKTTQQKLNEALQEIEEQKNTVSYLNKNINTLTDKLEEAGCTIVHAMGLDIEIQNQRADILENKLNRIEFVVDKFSNDSQLTTSVKNIIEGDDK